MDRGFLMTPYALRELSVMKVTQRETRMKPERYFILVSPPSSALPNTVSRRRATISPNPSTATTVYSSTCH